jgi:Cu/Ag efflux pump CusA
MVVYLHEALGKRIASGRPLTDADIHEAAIEGAVHRLRPKLMTLCVAAPMVDGMVQAEMETWDPPWTRKKESC